MNLFEKKAVVTGASTGLGRAIARELAKAGAELALIARNKDGLETTLSQIKEDGGKANIYVTDLRDENQINSTAEKILTKWKTVDIMINTAGVWHNENTVYAGSHLDNTAPDQINEVLDVGIKAPMLLTRHFIPGMKSMQSGKIVNISGVFFNGATGWLHYYVSKKAIEVFTVGLAEELQEDKIQVNCVNPADIATEPYKKFFPEYFDQALQPEEVAKIVLFLASSEADNITGQIIRVWNKKDTNRYIFAQ